MERYIEQLIEKLSEAEASPTPEPDFGNSYEEFAERMMEIETEEPSASENILNVSYEELPPVGRLNRKQIQDLTTALVNALAAKGTNVSFPMDGTPDELIYTELRERFKEGFHASPGWVIDFCTGWCPDCAFIDYCDSWQDTWTLEKIEEERAKAKQAE
jgi:hypothetical protein